MIVTIAAAALAAHLGAAPAPAGDTNSFVHQVRGGWCGHGYDIDIHGRCYPNGVILLSIRPRDNTVDTVPTDDTRVGTIHGTTVAISRF